MKHILLAAIFLSLSACGFEQVDTGRRGVKTTFGEAEGRSEWYLSGIDK